MKKFIFIVFLALLSGLLFLYSYVFIHKVSYGDIPILTYHGIDKRDNEYYLDPDKFEEMISELKDNDFTFLTAQDLYKIYNKEMDLPKKPVMVTLDDGYRDNYTNAFRILKKYDAKATIFLIGAFVDSSDQFLTWKMVEEMANSGLVDFESHTYNSHDLRLDGPHKGKTTFSTPSPGESSEDYYKRIYEDLVWNNNLIYSHTSVFPVAIAYPGGMTGEDGIVSQVVPDSGLKLGFLGAKKNASSIFDLHPYSVNRFNIKKSTDPKHFVKLITPKDK